MITEMCLLPKFWPNIFHRSQVLFISKDAIILCGPNRVTTAYPDNYYISRLSTAPASRPDYLRIQFQKYGACRFQISEYEWRVAWSQFANSGVASFETTQLI